MEKVQVGYHASHKQFKTSRLTDLTQQAQQADFTHSLSSIHYFPWSESQGESGFAWSWLGAAMQATTLGFGIVNAPGQRYHPAIIAQAVAILCEMFPGRFWIAAGSGQFLNEHIDGEKWPLTTIRNERLKESVDINIKDYRYLRVWWWRRQTGRSFNISQNFRQYISAFRMAGWRYQCRCFAFISSQCEYKTI